MLRYRLVALIYLLSLLPATMLGGSHTSAVGFRWDLFWQFELIVPTILAVLVLALAWTFTPRARS